MPPSSLLYSAGGTSWTGVGDFSPASSPRLLEKNLAMARCWYFAPTAHNVAFLSRKKEDVVGVVTGWGPTRDAEGSEQDQVREVEERLRGRITNI
jgi:hypothetical protein